MTVIAIDGTFASGKGTLGKGLAAHYGLPYLDTGKLYRATAKAVLDAGGDVENADDGARGAKSIAAENVLAQLVERDTRDSTRATAPLKPAEDAHLLDTTGMGIAEVLQAAIDICDAVLAQNSKTSS